MNKREFYYPSSDGKTRIHAVEWSPDESPKAILQIAHGVTEYILRYEEFAEYLTNKGILVVGNDHIGHGTSIAENAKPMYFGPEGSFKYAVDDVNTLYKTTKEKYENIPYIILGFSLGSFIVRRFLIDYPDTVDGAILVGTGQIAPIKIKIAKFIAKSEAKKHGEDNPTPMIKSLSFDNYNKLFKPNRTDYDWLCLSKTSLDKYIRDKNRGKEISAGLFREMLSGMEYTGNLENIKKMNKDIPIIFLSGEMDPVGEKGKSVKKAYSDFKKVGIEDVDMKLYKDLRHDILHEDNCVEIYNDIYNFIKEKVIK